MSTDIGILIQFVWLLFHVTTVIAFIRLYGEEVDRLEQHDAQEFFSCLADTVDEAMKICGLPKAIENVAGGIFENQMICIDCPHR